MQFCVITLALIGLVAADVSHLQHGVSGYNYDAPSVSFASSSASASLPGGDASSYQPEHLIPQQLKTAQVIPGGDSSSYQPEHLIPQELQPAQVIPGGDSSSYQPEHLIPQQLQPAQVIPGGDSSSYQPEHLIPQNLEDVNVETVDVQESFNIGADTQTPEQFIPEADRIAHYNYIHSQAKAALPTPAPAAQVVPGSDSSSYQPANLIPQHLKAVHQETVSESFNLGAQASAGAQQQAPVAIGANTITPARLYQEPTSNGIEEFNPETHVPVAIGGNTITPAHLQVKYSSGGSSSASSSSSSSGTQYGSNGGYVY